MQFPHNWYERWLTWILIDKIFSTLHSTLSQAAALRLVTDATPPPNKKKVEQKITIGHVSGPTERT